MNDKQLEIVLRFVKENIEIAKEEIKKDLKPEAIKQKFRKKFLFEVDERSKIGYKKIDCFKNLDSILNILDKFLEEEN